MRALSIIFGKLVGKLLRLTGRGGSALPGLLVERANPRLMAGMLNQLNDGVVVVTGTNGKTSTTKALVYLLEQSGLRVLTNPTGSNLTRGIVATLIQKADWFGRLDYDIAVLELDEAYSRIFAKAVPPRFVLALNVQRDQLDRYGEIDTTAQMIGETISYATEGVILNGDDQRTVELAKHTKAKVRYFGANEKLLKFLPSDDELHVPRTKHHKKKHKGKHRAAVRLEDFSNGSAAFRTNDKVYRSSLQVDGLHNALNITAALATALLVAPHIKAPFLIPTIAGIKSAFGRGEIITVDGKRVTLALVKNPSGFRQALRSYGQDSFDVSVFVINDKFADGRDVSWLWDVDFTILAKPGVMMASGIRSEDMALRLQYDKYELGRVSSDVNVTIDEALKQANERVIIYCTYTAMLAIRKELSRRSQVEDVW